MQNFTKAVVFALSLGAASAASASDAFPEAHDDALHAPMERSERSLPYAVASDAQDDSGVSARAFDDSASSVGAGAYARAADPHDDAGIGVPLHGATIERSHMGAAAASAAPLATPVRDCPCIS